MTQITAHTLTPESKSTAHNSVSPLAIALWLLVQLVAMILIVARVRLWIGGGSDDNALAIMLVTQIAFAALLMPEITQNLRTAVCVALASIPFLQLAGAISASDTSAVIRGASALSLWLITVYFANQLARSAASRATIHALTTCVSIGGVILLYLREEFSVGARAIDKAWFGPIAAAITLVRGESSADSIRRAWIQLVAIAGLLIIFWIVKRTFVVATPPRG